MAWQALFNPARFGLEGCEGVHVAVRRAVVAADSNVWNDLLLNVVISGGGSQLRGLQDRLQRELTAELEEARVPFNCNVLPAGGEHGDASLDAWVGGSILGSLEGIDEMWVSQQEYEEGGGPLAIDQKCPLFREAIPELELAALRTENEALRRLLNTADTPRQRSCLAQCTVSRQGPEADQDPTQGVLV